MACAAHHGDDQHQSGGTGGGDETELAPLETEAGFVEVPARSENADPRTRMFYSFVPADNGPESAPLLVYFNGGPGAATTSILAAYGTGPYTLDPEAEVDAPPAHNPASHTAFANMLYIDARATGFSYDVEDPADGYCSGAEPYTSDAAQFVYVLLEFLAEHPQIADNPIALVGESYGGTRAAVMLYMLQHYAVMEQPEWFPTGHLYAPWLTAKMRRHVAFALRRDTGVDLTPDEVARQFGYQILIQPSIAGFLQNFPGAPVPADDPDFENPGGDAYDVRQSVEDADRIAEHAAYAMRTPVSFEMFFGVAPQDVAGLPATERGAARRWPSGEILELEARMRGALGDLPESDAYWLPMVQPCGPYLGDGRTLSAFLDVLKRTSTFITNARYDSVVYTEALPAFFGSLDGYDAFVSKAEPAGSERPGMLHVVGDELGTRSIRFPIYEAGHAVTVSAPGEFARDVEQWLHDVGAMRPVVFD
ncbi:MAG: hypothetical protein HOW73_46865 [Polyangiaceae bacterium]|nr:hypothetical protein [Polyangiaceae bacterium]